MEGSHNGHALFPKHFLLYCNVFDVVIEFEMKVSETKMIKWMRCDVTRLDKIGNEYVRESVDATSVAEEMRENKFRRLGYVERRNNEGYSREDRGEIKVERNRRRSGRR